MASARTGNTVNGWPSRPRVIRLLVGLTVLGVVLALVGVLAPRVFTSGSGSDDADRKQVASRAADFATTYNTYDVADITGYQKRMKGLLTTTYDKQFTQVTDAVFKALKDKNQKSGDAKVLGVAINTIDKDSATAIVAVDASITNTDNKAAVLRHFRWTVTFTRSSSDWLVSNFESVAAVSAQAGSPTATPTPAATPTAGGGS